MHTRLCSFWDSTQSRRAFLCLCLCLLTSVQWGCESSHRCTPCTPNTRTCTQDSLYIQNCREIPGTGCYEILLEPCPQGTACHLSSGAPVCRSTQCPTSCTVGSFKCSQSPSSTVLLRCERDLTTGCTSFQAHRVCESGQKCDATQGVCSSSTECQSNVPNHSKRCVGQAVHWFDNCGEKGQQVEICSAQQMCKKGACEEKGTCVPQVSQHEKRCVGQAVHWFDNCEKQGEQIQICSAQQVCKKGVCEEQTNNPCPNACLKIGDTRCQGSDAYVECVDSGKPNCFIWSASAKCASGMCSNGKCEQKQMCSNTCTSGQKQCVGADVQECVQDAKGCWSWGPAQACPSGQTCKANACQKTAVAGSVGSACQSKTECLNGGTCLKKSGSGSGVCSIVCSGACGTNNACVGIPFSDGTKRYFCFRKCSSSSDCGAGLNCSKNSLCEPS